MLVLDVVAAPPGQSYFSYTTNYPAQYQVEGYDLLTRLEVFHVFDLKPKSHSVTHKGISYKVEWAPEVSTIRILNQKRTLMEVDVKNFITQLQRKTPGNQIDQSKLTLTQQSQHLDIQIYFDDVSGMLAPFEIAHFKSDILIRFK